MSRLNARPTRADAVKPRSGRCLPPAAAGNRAHAAGTVDGEVRFDAGSRGTYSTDASNYRQVPIGVVVPRIVEARTKPVTVCRQFGTPVVSRGGGTSLAGQAGRQAELCHKPVIVAGTGRPASKIRRQLTLQPSGLGAKRSQLAG